MQCTHKSLKLFSIYSVGSKCYLSFSQLISQIPKKLPTNVYLYQHAHLQSIPTNTIFRLIISPHLANKQMNLNINDLKANYLINHLHNNLEKELSYSASRIIANCTITNNQAKQTKNAIKQNMIELEKLFNDGLKIPISYMISKQNCHKEWKDIISKKKKAIHYVIEKSIKFNQLVYEQGYQLEHIFLSGYNKSQDGLKKQSKLSDDLINFKQFFEVLKMIMFKGKIILETDEHEDNVQFLEKYMKEVGFRKQDEVTDNSWLSAL